MPATINSFNEALHSGTKYDGTSSEDFKDVVVAFTVAPAGDGDGGAQPAPDGQAQIAPKGASIALGDFKVKKVVAAKDVNQATGRLKFKKRDTAEQANDRFEGKVAVRLEAVEETYASSGFHIAALFGFKSPQTDLYQDTKIVLIYDAENMLQPARAVPVDETMLPDLAKLFPHIGEARLREQMETQSDGGRVLYSITISHDGLPRAVALHVEHDFGNSKHQDLFGSISEITQKPGTATILCFMKDDDVIKEVNNRITSDKQENPLVTHFLKPKRGGQAPSYQHKQLLREFGDRALLGNDDPARKETDPAWRYPNVKPQITFGTTTEYMCRYLIATEIDWQALDQTKEVPVEVQVRFFDQGKDQKTGNRRVFGICEPAPIDVKEGDKVKLYFDEYHNDDNAYTGRRIRANYYSSISDLSFIFNAPIDPKTGQYVEHDFGGRTLPSVDLLESDADHARRYFRDAPSMTCYIVVDSSNKPFAHHFNAAQQLHSKRHEDNIKAWSDVLCGNKVKLDEGTNLFRGIPDEILVACFDVFNPNQMTVPDKMKNLWCKILLIPGAPGTGKTEVLLRLMLPFVIYGVPIQGLASQAPRLFCASTLNRSATKIVKRLKAICAEPRVTELLRKYRPNTDLLFIRGFAMNTEKKIYKREVQTARDLVVEPSHASVHKGADGEDADMPSDHEDPSGQMLQLKRHKRVKHATKTDFVPGQPLSAAMITEVIDTLNQRIEDALQKLVRHENAENKAAFAEAKREYFESKRHGKGEAIAEAITEEIATDKLEDNFKLAWATLGEKACELYTKAAGGDQDASYELTKAANAMKKTMALAAITRGGESSRNTNAGQDYNAQTEMLDAFEQSQKAKRGLSIQDSVADTTASEHIDVEMLSVLDKMNEGNESVKPKNVIMQMWKEDAFRTHLVDDDRVTEDDLVDATGTAMLRVAGRITKSDGQPYSYANVAAHKKFNKYMDVFRAGVEFTAENMTNFKEVATNLMNDTISRCDIFVSTLFSAGTASVYKALTSHEDVRPRTNRSCFIDEFGKAVEPDLWPVIAMLGMDHIIAAGDSKQVCGRTYTRDNPFAAQISVSPMARFELIGVPTQRLTIQHRMHSHICMPISQYFYDGLITTHPDVDKRKSAQCAREFSDKHFKIPSNVVLIDVKGGLEQQREGMTSFFNVDNVRVTSHIVEKMLKDENFRKHIPPHEIVVLSGYSAQTDLHSRSRDERSRAPTLKGLDSEGVTVCNIDSIQGEEASAVILDLTRTSALGFLTNPNRINMALSRPRDLLIVVGNLAKLRVAKRFQFTAIGKFINHLKDKRLIHTIVPSDCTPVESINPHSSLYRDFQKSGLDEQIEARRAALMVSVARRGTAPLDRVWASSGSAWRKRPAPVDNWEVAPKSGATWDQPAGDNSWADLSSTAQNDQVTEPGIPEAASSYAQTTDHGYSWAEAPAEPQYDPTSHGEEQDHQMDQEQDDQQEQDAEMDEFEGLSGRHDY